MNRRKAKKAHKKVCYSLIDEMNLLTLNDEEYKQAMKDFNDYVWRYRRYKHYKDKEKVSQKPCCYFFPVGEAYKKRMEQVLKLARKFPCKTTIVMQSIDDVEKQYPMVVDQNQ